MFTKFDEVLDELRKRDDIIAGAQQTTSNIALDSQLFTSIKLIARPDNGKLYIADGTGKILQFTQTQVGETITLTYDEKYFLDATVESLPVGMLLNISDSTVVVLFEDSTIGNYSLTDTNDISTADYNNVQSMDFSDHVTNPIYITQSQTGDEIFIVQTNGEYAVYDIVDGAPVYSETIDTGIPDVTSIFVSDSVVFYLTNETIPKLYWADANNPTVSTLLYTSKNGEILSGIELRTNDSNLFLGKELNGVFSVLQILPATDISGNVICDSQGFMTYSKSGASRTTNRLYEGVDLTVKFADEIAEYDNSWDWVLSRIEANDFTGLDVGDYIPFTLSAGTITDGVTPYVISEQTFNAQIIGLNPYQYYSSIPDPHIDFMTKEVIDTKIPFQLSDNNNGTSVEINPFRSSVLYAILNGVNNYTTSAFNSVPHGYDASGGGILQLLPQALQDVIIEKVQYLENKYSGGGLLTSSINKFVESMGKLWVPNEFEVYGSLLWSNAYANLNALQYPIFNGNMISRLKRDSDGNRIGYWLSAVNNTSSFLACYVVSSGHASIIECDSSNVSAPICFRIGNGGT